MPIFAVMKEKRKLQKSGHETGSSQDSSGANAGSASGDGNGAGGSSGSGGHGGDGADLGGGGHGNQSGGLSRRGRSRGGGRVLRLRGDGADSGGDRHNGRDDGRGVSRAVGDSRGARGDGQSGRGIDGAGGPLGGRLRSRAGGGSSSAVLGRAGSSGGILGLRHAGGGGDRDLRRGGNLSSAGRVGGGGRGVSNARASRRDGGSVVVAVLIVRGDGGDLAREILGAELLGLLDEASIGQLTVAVVGLLFWMLVPRFRDTCCSYRGRLTQKGYSQALATSAKAPKLTMAARILKVLGG